jgi:hypothetical protein
MATHDYNIANQGFPAFRADLNDALAAIVSNNSNATAPATTFAHMLWVDTAANPSVLKIRNADNDAWITIGTIDQTGDTFTLTSAVSATTLNTSGQVVFNDAGADVDFRVEGDTNANLLFVDASSDRVGINTTSPNAKFEVASGASGETVGLFLADAENNTVYVGRLSSVGGSGSSFIVRGRQNVNVFTVDANANNAKTATTLGVGDAEPADSGAGITFPATQSASTNANTLDDYEEGTWTPVFTYSTPGTLSTTQEGRGSYRKIGSVVYFTSDIRINAFTKGTASGDLLITGFPFTSLNVGGYQDAKIIIHLWEWTFSSQPVAKVDGNTTFSTLGRMRSNQTQTALDDPKSGSIIWLTGFYFTA